VESDRYWFDPDNKANSQCMRWEITEEYCYMGKQREHTQILQQVFLHMRPGVYRPTRVPSPSDDVWDSEKEAQFEIILAEHTRAGVGDSEKGLRPEKTVKTYWGRTRTRVVLGPSQPFQGGNPT
jgi:hypothetical protein